MSMSRSDWESLPSILRDAVKEYNDWSYAHLSETDIVNRINKPLYHYTDAVGLEGIIKNQEVWFTSFKHLNDPTEIEYGMSIAAELLKEIGAESDPRIKLFCDMVNNLF